MGEGIVLITAREYEALVRDSERLAMVKNYLTNDKFSILGTVEKMLGIEKGKAGEEQ